MEMRHVTPEQLRRAGRLSRRGAARRLGVAAIVGALAAQTGRGAWAQDATPSAGVRREQLIAETEGLMDSFGRVPLARLTVAPGASLPEPFLYGPLIVLVETGDFDVWVGSAASPSQAGPGARFDVAEVTGITARNIGETDGSCLVLAVGGDSVDSISSAAWFLAEQSPAPGVAWRLLFTEQDIAERFSSKRFSLDRITLAPGSTLDGSQLEGSTMTRSVWLLVEAGAVVGERAWTVASGATPAPEAAPGGEVELQPGDVGRFDLAEARAVRAVGGEPAVVLVVRVADEEEF